MTTELVQPAPGGLTKLAQDLLKAAAELGLPASVVEWSPTRNGFVVPAAVAAAYAAEASGMDVDLVDADGEPFTGASVVVADPETVLEQSPELLPPGQVPLTGGPELLVGELNEQPEPEPALDFRADETPREETGEQTGNGRYSDEQKTAAVRQVLDDGRTIRAVAEEIGASENTVSRWVKAAKAEGEVDG